MQANPADQSSDAIKDAAESIKPAPESIEEAASSIREQVGESFDAFVDRLPLFAAAVVVLLATWLSARLIQALLAWVLSKLPVSESKRVLVSRAAGVAIWLVGGVLATVIGFPGLSTSKAFAVIAIAGTALGFAFRDLAENLFAGVLLLSQFPFGHGDFIDGGQSSGTVEAVTLRMTKLRTVSGELVVVPNSKLYRSEISILTNSEKLRTHIDVTVDYGTQIQLATASIEEALAQCSSVAGDPPAEALAWKFGDSGVVLRVAWWTSPLPLEIRRSRSEVVTAIYEALSEAGITIPYPHQTIRILEARDSTASKSQDRSEGDNDETANPID